MFYQFVTAALQVSTAEKAEASPSAQDLCHGLVAYHWPTQNSIVYKKTLQVQDVDKLPDCPNQFVLTVVPCFKPVSHKRELKQALAIYQLSLRGFAHERHPWTMQATMSGNIEGPLNP